MYKELIAIDALSTGSDPRRDDIFQLAAVEIIDGQPRRIFARLADPGSPVALRVRKAAGVSAADIDRAPPLQDVISEFLDFTGDRPCIAHDFENRLLFIEEATYNRFQNTVLDTVDLARAVLPAEDRYELDYLAGKYELNLPHENAAAAGALRVAGLWRALQDELKRMPVAALDAMLAILEPVDWQFKPLLLYVHSQRFAEGFGGHASLAACLPDFSGVINEAQQRRSKREAEAPKEEDEQEQKSYTPLDTQKIIDTFGPKGVFAKRLDNFEPRREQARMAKAVAYAFNTRKHLMVEAGTGTGKSLAYLVPAVKWAARNETPIVISTYTKNLQAQLFFKDIPMLAGMLGQEFKAAVVKGRANYLCPRKLEYLLAEASREITEDERIALLPVISWAVMTDTGDISENTGFQAARMTQLWDRLYATGDECRGRNCDYWKHCFLLKARAQAQMSDIIIANHAVVLSELGIDSSAALPPHKHLIIDEAHNLEHVATDTLGCVFDRWRIMRPLNRLYRMTRRDRSGYGILTNLLFNLRKGRELQQTEGERLIAGKIEKAFEGVLEVEVIANEFLGSLRELFAPGDAGVRQRYDSTMQPVEKWRDIFAHKKALIAGLSRLVSELEKVLALLDDMERDFQYKQDLMLQLDAQLAALREIIEDIEFLLKADDAKYVFWAECIDYYQSSYRLAAAPIEVGELLKSLLYEKRDTIVFSSATLAVSGSFDFFKERLGLNLLEPERVLALSLGTSFDFQKQVLFCVPAFLPEPVYRQTDFTEALESLLVDLHVETRGRGLILFTSYDILNKVYPGVKRELEREEILVLGQGFDGSPDLIMRTFRRIHESVLLGTQSFWEGIDVPGESLSCLTLTKLPFAVHTDPIVKARCEAVEARGGSSFMNFSVPMAVIRFKQGFGRLIRSKTDRGVVLVLDRRVISKRYGKAFLESVPVTHRVYNDKETLLKDVGGFLGIRSPQST